MRLILCIFCILSFTQTLNVYSKTNIDSDNFHNYKQTSAIEELDSSTLNLEASILKLNKNLSKINNNVKSN